MNKAVIVAKTKAQGMQFAMDVRMATNEFILVTEEGDIHKLMGLERLPVFLLPGWPDHMKKIGEFLSFLKARRFHVFGAI